MVTLAPPRDPDIVSHELTIRVPNCRAAYDTLTARGAVFLTPPVDWGAEIRCFFRDPDVAATHTPRRVYVPRV